MCMAFSCIEEVIWKLGVDSESRGRLHLESEGEIMEEFRCLDCNHVAELNPQGLCSACLSSAVIAEEVIKIHDIDYVYVNPTNRN